MPDSGSVSFWVAQLKAGDAVAAGRFWEGYYRRLVGLARKRLQGQPRAAADEEDVALRAFASFCRGAERNQFPRLDDRDDLWQGLVLVTARKASRLIRHERALKRGGAAVRHAEALDEDGADVLAEVIGREPTPEFAAQVAEDIDCCWTGWKRARAWWRWPRWRATPTPRSPPAWTCRNGPWSGAWLSSASSGKGRTNNDCAAVAVAW